MTQTTSPALAVFAALAIAASGATAQDLKERLINTFGCAEMAV